MINISESQIRYFMRGHVLLAFESDKPITARRVREFIGTDERIGQLLKGAEVNQERLLDFYRVKDRAQPYFALVFLTLPSDGRPAEETEDFEQVARTVREVNEGLPRRGGDGIQLTVATPNWLVGGAQKHITTGGPGALPVPVSLDAAFYKSEITDTNTPFSFRLGRFSLSSAGVKLSAQAKARSQAKQTKLRQAFNNRVLKPQSSVEVAILDTVPSRDTLRSAYQKWHHIHPLVRSLIAPDGTLNKPHRTTEIPGLEELTRTDDDYGLLKHDYQMADHGLFVAGIVHTIAPYAQLNLVRVLNDYGVGNVETLARGFHVVLADRNRDNSATLIINCSLTMSIPRDKELLLSGESELLKALGDAGKMALPFEWVCSLALASNHRALIVAAAGNDGKRGQPRPVARYPAAFDEIVGVGALRKNRRTAAVYSNISDRRVPQGVATFGGDVDSGQRKADVRNGVMGIYTGDFPDDQSGKTLLNETGWARWAGTSFATPMVAGILALLCGHGSSPAQAKETVYDVDAGPPPGQEHILPLKQGN